MNETDKQKDTLIKQEFLIMFLTVKISGCSAFDQYNLSPEEWFAP